MPYAYCEEVRTFTAEVVDGGFFGRNKIKSISNEKFHTRIVTESLSMDSTLNDLNRNLSGQKDGVGTGNLLDLATDMAQVQSNCENQRSTLELQARHVDEDLAAQCR